LLLEHLLQLVNQAPVLLILLYRPERAKRCWQIHEKARREYAYCYTEIPLHALDASTSQEMLANLVGVEAWPADLRQLILSRTEGNPLYLEEIIRSLINDGALVQQPDGKWALGSAVDASQVPDTLQGVIMARLDRLEEPCRWTAQVASVVGRLFAFDVLAHITAEYADRPVNACLVQLQQHEVVRETQRIPEITYIFKHTLVQEVCYTSLPLRARRDYHRKIASYLESSLRDGWQRAEIVTPLVAHHAFAGQDWPRALDYQILAGRQSQKLFANQEAIEHFQVALACAENLPAAATAPARLAAHLALGELLTISSRYEQARDHLLQADSLAVSLADADSRSHACRWLARLHELRGEYPQAFEWIEGGLAALGGRQTAEAAQLHINAGLIYTRLGDLDSAVRHSQTALEIANRLGELAALARANNLLGVITRNRGDNLAAAGYFQTALELYRQAGDIHGQAITHNLIANACFNTGGWQDASHHYRQARQIFDQIGDVYNRVIADNNLGGIALNQGRVDEAVAFYQQALASLEQIGGSAYVLGIVVMNLGAAFIRKGRADQAREHLHISQNYFGQAKSRDFLPEMHRHLARAALIAGEPGQAEAQCQEALRLARELSMRSEEGCCLRVLGEIAREQGRLDQARTVLEESVHILQEIADEYELARSQFSLARVYAALGLRPQARELMEQCTGVFRRLEAAMDLLAAEVLVQSLDGHLGYRAI
jgi:tetratricopeptide (TPR) repeat protein